MFSSRFQRKVVLTRHARDRMAERNITEMMLMEVIDSGETRYRDSTHLWAYKEFPERNDNLLCAVLVLEDAVVVKTVMHHFSLN
jgi:predicted oxidoreductase (fatty acid repression mutant protein)